MRLKKFTYILILTLALSACASEAATRRRTTTPAQNAASVPQSGVGENMTAEEEQALMDAAKAMRNSGLVQFNFKDMDLVFDKEE